MGFCSAASVDKLHDNSPFSVPDSDMCRLMSRFIILIQALRLYDIRICIFHNIQSIYLAWFNNLLKLE